MWNSASKLLWTAIRGAAERFASIDGEQRAAAFAYYAFLSLFPLLMLLVTAGSFVMDRDRAVGAITAYVERYFPLDDQMRGYIFATIEGIVKGREEAGTLAALVLVWSSLKFFAALIRAVNRAWAVGVLNWWRLPVRGLTFLGILASAVLLGICVPVVASRAWISPVLGVGWVSDLLGSILPPLALFCGLGLFYKLAPRRNTRFAEVWVAALLVTVLLRLLETLFLAYLEQFARLSAVYGALGSIVGFLMWIYVSGNILIFGACLCAAQAQASGRAAATPS